MTDGSEDRNAEGHRASGPSDDRLRMEGRALYLNEDSDAPTTLEAVNTLLRHRRLLVVLPLAVALLAVGHGLLSDVTYSSSASFMPQGQRSQASRLGGIAAQFGVNLSDVGGGESPQFYADLLHSSRLLGRAVDTQYRVVAQGQGPADTLRGDLVQLYDIEGESRRRRRDAAIERLRSRVSVQVNEQTAVVRMSVSAPWPDLAAQLADRLIQLVQQFNVDQRQSRGEAEREFLEERVADAREDLLVAEDSLQTFLEANRGLEGSPTLRFERDRLQRRVNLQQQVFTSLAQSLEEAKVQAVRNTPVITVVEPPRVPVRPDSRMIVARAALGLLVGGMFAVFVAFGSRLVAHARREEAGQYEEFVELRDATLDDIRELLGPLSPVLDRLRDRIGWGSGEKRDAPGGREDR